MVCVLGMRIPLRNPLVIWSDLKTLITEGKAGLLSITQCLSFFFLFPFFFFFLSLTLFVVSPYKKVWMGKDEHSFNSLSLNPPQRADRFGRSPKNQHPYWTHFAVGHLFKPSKTFLQSCLYFSDNYLI